MKQILIIAVLALAGCQTTAWTYNMKQSTSRGAGDIAMTALLDQGADKTEAVQFCEALIKWLEQGTLTKLVFREKAADLLEKYSDPAYVEYCDALFAVIPSRIGYHDRIPVQTRAALLSFLKDGALHGAELYRTEPREASDVDTSE